MNNKAKIEALGMPVLLHNPPNDMHKVIGATAQPCVAVPGARAYIRVDLQEGETENAMLGRLLKEVRASLDRVKRRGAKIERLRKEGDARAAAKLAAREAAKPKRKRKT